MDDVVENISAVQQFAKENNKNQTEKWFSLDEDHLFVDFCHKMIEIAKNPFDLSECRLRFVNIIAWSIYFVAFSKSFI